MAAHEHLLKSHGAAHLLEDVASLEQRAMPLDASVDQRDDGCFEHEQLAIGRGA